MNATKANQRSLLASVFIDNVGSGIHMLAVGRMLYEATGSVWGFGLSILSEYGLAILLQVAAGSAVDRGSPRRIAMLSDLIRGVALLGVAACVGSHWSLVAMWLGVLIVNAGKPYARSASFALIPQAVGEGQLSRYYSLASSCLQAGSLVGVAIAGPLLAAGGVRADLVLDGATYVLAAFLIGSLKLPSSAPRRAPALASGYLAKLKGDLAELATLLHRDRGFLWNVVLANADFLALSFLNLALFPIVNGRLGGSPFWLTALDGGFALASLGTALMVGRIRRTAFSASTFLGLEALCLIGLALVSGPVATVALYLLMGACNACSLSVFLTSLQQRTAVAVKGRVAGARHLLLALMSAALVPAVAFFHSCSLLAGLTASGALLLAFAVATAVAQTTLRQTQSVIFTTSSDRRAA